MIKEVDYISNSCSVTFKWLQLRLNLVELLFSSIRALINDDLWTLLFN